MARMSQVQCSFKAIDIGKPTFGIEIRDLGSRNGTWVNNRKLEQDKCTIVTKNCVIAFGQWNPRKPPRPDSRLELTLHGCDIDYEQSSTYSPLPAIGDPYVLMESLGQGGFGSVMRAYHLQERREYAIKLIRADQSSIRAVDESSTGRQERRCKHLQDEIDILKQLNHPHIVEFKEALYYDGGLGLVLEFMPGGDLEKYISGWRHHHKEKGDPGLPEWAAKYFMHQICQALDYLHQQGIVHRDLKPGNILLSDEKPPVAKLADFNLAKIVTGPTALLSNVCGTHLYMAPEIRGGTVKKTKYEKSVDSWSLGVTLSMMLWNRTPWQEDDRSKLDQLLLSSRCISQHCRDVLVDLLQYKAKKRKSPAAVLSSPWLAGKIVWWETEQGPAASSTSDDSEGGSTSSGVQSLRGGTSLGLLGGEGINMSAQLTETVNSEQTWDGTDFLVAHMSVVRAETLPLQGSSVGQRRDARRHASSIMNMPLDYRTER
ncbi:kinase-like domain-containing protein [Cerioporus squamosus]|nr:kinase-like domain-containing protein [Cerioporus squamosus]